MSITKFTGSVCSLTLEHFPQIQCCFSTKQGAQGLKAVFLCVPGTHVTPALIGKRYEKTIPFGGWRSNIEITQGLGDTSAHER